MKKIHLFLICLCFVQISTIAQTEKEKSSSHESEWKGFKRLEFDFENTTATITFPKELKDNNPWVWRAHFPSFHAETDSILVSEGYVVAFVNTNNRFGSPGAMKIWDKFYTFVIEKYNLKSKVALFGISRGGLYVYNWAKKNPEKVACIYAEAPVCDFKSWPGGLGEGQYEKNTWENLKKEYGFKNDEEAKAYSNNPIDNLESLAKHKVPILHMIGLNDKIVVPEENTFVLVDRYLKLGGPATIIPCTLKPQKAKGHHFPIETPRIAADFIKYYCEQE